MQLSWMSAKDIQNFQQGQPNDRALAEDAIKNNMDRPQAELEQEAMFSCAAKLKQRNTKNNRKIV